MKKIILLIAFYSCCCIAIFGQANVEYIAAEYNNWKVSKILHADGNTFLAGSARDCETGLLMSFNQFGEKAWELTSGSCGSISDIHYNEEESLLYVLSNVSGCDFLGEFHGLQFMKVSLEGQIIFQQDITLGEYPTLNPYSKAYFGWNNEDQFIISNRANIFIVNDSIQVESHVHHLNRDFNEVFYYDENRIFLKEDQKIAVLDINNQIQSSIEFNIPILDWALDNEILSVLTADQIHFYNIETLETTAQNLPNFEASVKGFETDLNSIYIWDEFEFKTNKIYQLDRATLTITTSVDLSEKEMRIEDIFKDGFNLYCAGVHPGLEENFFLKNKSFGFVKTIPALFEPTFDYSADIAMSNLQILQPVELIEYFPMDGIYDFANDFMPFSFDITNEGSSSVNSFSVTSQSLSGWFCLDWAFWKHYEGLNILPGETVTITDSIDSYIIYVQNIDSLHLAAHAPNHKFDGNPLNNNTDSFSEVIVDVDEVLKQKQLAISITPNPAQDRINIILEETIPSFNLDVEFFDAIGNKVYQTELKNSTHRTIHLDKFSSGIYFVKIKSKEGHFAIKKLIVQ